MGFMMIKTDITKFKKLDCNFGYMNKILSDMRDGIFFLNIYYPCYINSDGRWSNVIGYKLQGKIQIIYSKFDSYKINLFKKMINIMTNDLLYDENFGVILITKNNVEFEDDNLEFLYLDIE